MHSTLRFCSLQMADFLGLADLVAGVLRWLRNLLETEVRYQNKKFVIGTGWTSKVRAEDERFDDTHEYIRWATQVCARVLSNSMHSQAHVFLEWCWQMPSRCEWGMLRRTPQDDQTRPN